MYHLWVLISIALERTKDLAIICHSYDFDSESEIASKQYFFSLLKIYSCLVAKLTSQMFISEVQMVHYKTFPNATNTDTIKTMLFS